MEPPLNQHWLPRIRANFDTKPVDELAAIYAKHDVAEWSPEAFQVIRDIFQERNLALPKILPKPEASGPPGIRSYSFCGFGTTLIGKRDFGRDHTYVTTQWLVLFFVPVFPFRSLRVRVRPRDDSKRIKLGPVWRENYDVSEVTRPNPKQVLCVYGLTLLLGLWFVAFNSMKNGNVHVFFLGVVLLFLIPFVMRHLAKRWAGL